jgi:VanZ family protein
VRRFVLYILPILAYAGMIYFLSSRSHLPLPAVTGLDKVAHFTEYALFGVLLSRALIGFGARPAVALWVTVGLCLLYGASDEFHQRFVPGRSADVRDLAADVIGGTAGALTLYAVRRMERT